jgi:hypothetical protein
MHVCLSCYEVYDQSFLKSVFIEGYGEFICPKVSCDSGVVELDELIAPTIIELNKKGYITQYCCGGHWYNSLFSAYIMFYDDCMPETIPDGFIKESENVIRYRVEGEFDKFEESLKVGKLLYDWSKGLPECEW